MRSADYTAEALRDLKNIWEHYAQKSSVEAADALVDRILETFRRTVLLFPTSGRARPEFGYGIRSYPVVPYVVFYRIEGRRLQILRLLHGRRDIHAPLMSLLAAI